MKGVIYFTVIAFIFALLIVILDKFINKRDTKVDKVLELLPGYNCGACGYGSCMGLASAISKDVKLIDKCRVISDEDKEKIRSIYEKK